MTEEKSNESIETGEDKAVEETAKESPETAPADDNKSREAETKTETKPDEGSGRKSSSGAKTGSDREERKDRRSSSDNRPQRDYRSDQQSRVPRFRRKVCRFCHEENLEIDYKNREILERFITDRGKILPRRVTGTCAKHQRLLARAIKKARYIALIPYVEK